MPRIVDRLQDALGDRFAELEEIGVGGMAFVFRATDVRHGRTVAVKVVQPEIAESVGTGRFLREIRVTASMAHPNIPPLLESGEADGLLYYVMPYMEGSTLRDRLAEEGRLAVGEALNVARDVADALDYAHRVGLVHRDVKPGNIFLEEGHALLGDFGIALAEQSSDTLKTTSENSVLGTATYMSPEQCTGSHRVDARSDIYSLGCILYEMLGGEPPFVGRSHVAVVARHISEPPPSATMLRGDVPDEVDEVIRTCLAKAPGDRFQSAGELRDALDDALVRQHSKWTGLSRLPWRRRVSMRAGAVVAIVVILAAVGLFLTMGPDTMTAASPDRVVVFPLADRGGDVPVGADVAILIGNALVHTDPLRWIDGWEMLSPSERVDPNLLTGERARAISIGRGARYFITGGVVAASDSIGVRLVLHDAVGDSIVRQAIAEDHVADSQPGNLGLRAVVELLPSLLDPGRSIDVSHLTTREPAAVAMWIEGDRRYRRARFDEALNLYRQAVETDSLLVMAALKGARAASWSEQLTLAEDLLQHAVQHDSILPPRYRAFAAGLAASSSGDADGAVAHLRGALAEDDQWAEAWASLGEVYWHLIPSDLGGADSAVAFFRRARTHDPQFSPPLVHLAEQEFRHGRAIEGRGLLEELRESRGDSVIPMRWLTAMSECAEPGEVSVQRFVRSATDPLPILHASRLYAAGGARLDCAEAGFRRVLGFPELTPGEEWMVILGLQGVLAAQGREDELTRFLTDALSQQASTNFLFALDVVAGAQIREQATDAYDAAEAAWGPDFETIGPVTSWLLAVWNAHERDLATLDRLVDRLESLAAERGDSHTAVLAEAARGHRALALGDSARALVVFSGLVSRGTRLGLDVELAEPLAPERILLAELLLARGEYSRAYRVASIFDHPEPLIFLPYLPRSLAVRARAAQALSESEEWARRTQEANDRLQALRPSYALPRAGKATRERPDSNVISPNPGGSR